MTTRYLVAADGHCLCNEHDLTVTFNQQEAEAALRHLHSEGIKNAQIIQINI